MKALLALLGFGAAALALGGAGGQGSSAPGSSGVSRGNAWKKKTLPHPGRVLTVERAWPVAAEVPSSADSTVNGFTVFSWSANESGVVLVDVYQTVDVGPKRACASERYRLNFESGELQSFAPLVGVAAVQQGGELPPCAENSAPLDNVTARSVAFVQVGSKVNVRITASGICQGSWGPAGDGVMEAGVPCRVYSNAYGTDPYTLRTRTRARSA
jgi:hypothetical protein